MVEVLCSSYMDLFCHLPPVSREPVELSSYGLESVKAQALQAGVDIMLEKGAVVVVYHCVWVTTVTCSWSRKQ